MYKTRFRVTGQLPFPVDMLRYDNCFPGSQEAASYIATKTFPESREDRRSCPIIELCTCHSNKNWAPTKARWESFGWWVTEVELPVKV